MNILINGIGGPTPRSIALRLRALYPTATLVGLDVNEKAIGFYLNGLVDYSYLVPRASEPTYWEALNRIVAKHGIDLAFVQPEAEVKAWGRHQHNHASLPCPALIPPLAFSEQLVNKARMSELLAGTPFIPKTVRITQEDPRMEELQEVIGFPCWIRASEGTGGYGSLKINRKEDLEAWLFIQNEIREFTVSEFLPGRHLANQMLYLDGKCVRNAGLECVEYVMANVAPSKVTGNTSYGRLIYDEKLLSFCEDCMDYISDKLQVKPHGVFSFDLKETAEGALKVTEVNVRHMAYTGIMARAGFDLVKDTVDYLQGRFDPGPANGRYRFKKDYIFLRDVDIEPMLMEQSDLLAKG